MRKLIMMDPAEDRRAKLQGKVTLAIAKACFPLSQTLAKQGEELAALRASIELEKAQRACHGA